MQRTRIVGVGAGGAFSLYESLVRSGIRNLTVIDYDTVEETNIVRQGYGSHDIGELKVNALNNYLRQINNELEYQGIPANILSLSEQELNAYFADADLLLFLSDSHKAQALGNRLAIKYNKPAIWAGYYGLSRAAEIVFTIPGGITKACYRCAVSDRYRIQAEAKTEVSVSSNGNTIFHSKLLDSLIGMLCLAILHNDIQGYEFSNWFGSSWDRNLIQVKVHPQYGSKEGSLFDRTFGPLNGAGYTFTPIWQKIEREVPPKYEPCPDCAATY